MPFADAAQANAWLERKVAVAASDLERRPDLRALDAAVRAARAAQTLASRGWIPDPTVRVGYVRDQFVVSGNQQNSLFVGLSLPLPIFERGEDDAEAAAVAARSAERAREQLLAAAHTQLGQLTSSVAAVEGRQLRIREQSLPLAHTVVDRLTAAVTRGAAPLQELLLARRTLSELLLTGTELDRTALPPARRPGAPQQHARRAPRPMTSRSPMSKSLLVSSVLLLASAGCTRAARDVDAASALKADAKGVTLAADAPQWKYVELSVATAGPSLPPLPVPGHVDLDPKRTAAVGVPLPGRVEAVLIRLGARVKQGDKLFSVRSGAFADLDRETEAARAQVAVR